MAIGGYDPIGITFFGGIKINAQDNTSSFNIGDTFIQSPSSSMKNNMIQGQVFGDFHSNSYQAIGTCIYDSDALDGFNPSNSAPVGLED